MGKLNKIAKSKEENKLPEISIEDRALIALNIREIYTLIRNAAIQNLQDADMNQMVTINYETGILKVELSLQNEINLIDIIRLLKSK